MTTNNVVINLSIIDGNTRYKGTWGISPDLFNQPHYKDLPRTRQISKVIVDNLLTEIGHTLFDNPIEIVTGEEEPVEVFTGDLAPLLEPEYSFKNYTLDVDKQLDYQKKLIKHFDFTAGWIAPTPWKPLFRVFAYSYHKIPDSDRVHPVLDEQEFETFKEVDDFYNRKVKYLLSLIENDN